MMSGTPQYIYAKNLRQSFGYPLRCPEPQPGLPPCYEENGLHIGDVGYVDGDGMFRVLFNICFSLDHELHWARRTDLVGLVGLTEFKPNEAPPIPNVFPSGHVISHGIQVSHGNNLKHTQIAPCKFMSRSSSGAMLILPSGAVHQYLDENKEKEFRKLAEKHALGWLEFAPCKTLLLITGFYKTSSWHLASFHGASAREQILLGRDDTGRYIWNSKCDCRQSSMENRNENQTLFISGFKLVVWGWDRHTVIEKLAGSRSVWSELTLLMRSLLGILVFFWRRLVSRGVLKIWGRENRVDHVPA